MFAFETWRKQMRTYKIYQLKSRFIWFISSSLRQIQLKQLSSLSLIFKHEDLVHLHSASEYAIMVFHCTLIHIHYSEQQDRETPRVLLLDDKITMDGKVKVILGSCGYMLIFISEAEWVLCTQTLISRLLRMNPIIFINWKPCAHGYLGPLLLTWFNWD